MFWWEVQSLPLTCSAIPLVVLGGLGLRRGVWEAELGSYLGSSPESMVSGCFTLLSQGKPMTLTTVVYSRVHSQGCQRTGVGGGGGEDTQPTSGKALQSKHMGWPHSVIS